MIGKLRAGRPARAFPGFVALALSLAPALAFADLAAADRALAQALFDEGRKLLQAGSLADACPKLEKSQALDPSGGTLLNLALCHEKQGRTATAWIEYHDAIAMARKDHRPEREQFAATHVEALEPSLSRLTVKVSVEGLPEGFEVTRDGAPLQRAGWNVAAPVDPGPHVIGARAPGFESWKLEVSLGDRADTKVVEIPALRRLASAPPAVEGLAPVTSVASPPPPPPPGTGVQRPLGIALGSLGIVAVGIGVGFGVHALAQEGTAHGLCKSDATCAAGPGLSASRDAVTSAKVADGLLFGGLGLVGVGLTVALTAKTADRPATALRVVPRGATLAVSF